MNDKNLDQLIASIKTEAIDAAEKEAKKILDAAALKAQAIQEQGEAKKRQITADAAQAAEEMVRKGKIALQQAARDLTLSLQQDLLNFYHLALEKEIRKEFSPGLIQSVISAVIQNTGNGVEIQLPPETMQELGDYIRDYVQKPGNGISFAGNDSLPAGMKIKKTAEGWSYDITPETITEALFPYLTDNWIKILKGEEQT